MKKNVVFCLVFLDAIVWEAYALVYYFVERLHQAVGYEVICLQLDGFVWGCWFPRCGQCGVFNKRRTTLLIYTRSHLLCIRALRGSVVAGFGASSAVIELDSDPTLTVGS